MAITNGQTADADEVLNAIGSNFNDVAQNLFNADYIGFDSRLANTGAPSLKNVKYSTFTTDDVDTNYGFTYDSTNDLYVAVDFSSVSYYVIIEASSYTGSNTTEVIPIASGKWIIIDSTGDANVEVQRAKIWNTLLNSKELANFTSTTALKVSDSGDVGYRYYKYAQTEQTNNGGNESKRATGTFGTTTGNTVSSWSKVRCLATSSGACRWEVPSATTLNTASSGTSDEFGTDLSADEKTNPSNCQLELNTTNASGSGQSGGVLIVLTKGTLSWSSNWSNNGSPGFSNEEVDFFTDHSIPESTLADSLATEGATPDSTLIFKDTVTSTDNAIPVINSSIDATSSKVISVSADGGSNWTDVDKAEVARPTAGTELWRRIVITRTDLSKLDKVTEQAVKYELY